MRIFKRVDFGPEAIEYIRDSLTRGNSLSKHLLQLPLERGSVFAYLPENVTLEESRKFTVGGLIRPKEVRYFEWGRAEMLDRDEIDEQTAHFIVTYLAKEGQRYCIFENINARPSDPFLMKVSYSVFFYLSEVYAFCPPRTDNTDQIISVKNGAATPFFAMGALSSLPDNIRELENRQEVTDDILKTLALRTEYLIIRAYDGEGDLIWCRETRYPL